MNADKSADRAFWVVSLSLIIGYREKKQTLNTFVPAQMRLTWYLNHWNMKMDSWKTKGFGNCTFSHYICSWIGHMPQNPKDTSHQPIQSQPYGVQNISSQVSLAATWLLSHIKGPRRDSPFPVTSLPQAGVNVGNAGKTIWSQHTRSPSWKRRWSNGIWKNLKWMRWMCTWKPARHWRVEI